MADFPKFLLFWLAGFGVALALSIIVILLAILAGLIMSAVDWAKAYYGPNWAVVTFMRGDTFYRVTHTDRTEYLAILKDRLSKPAAKRECRRLTEAARG